MKINCIIMMLTVVENRLESCVMQYDLFLVGVIIMLKYG
jgi:hypothetical protein